MRRSTLGGKCIFHIYILSYMLLSYHTTTLVLQLRTLRHKSIDRLPRVLTEDLGNPGGVALELTLGWCVIFAARSDFRQICSNQSQKALFGNQNSGFITF